VAREGQELVVIAKAYDLVLRSCHNTSSFPRSHRFVLGERIEGNLCDLLETLKQARNTRERHGLLGQAKVGEPKLLSAKKMGGSRTAGV
jgi:hypothetical protein